MFFRREKPRVHTFSDRLTDIRGAGFQVQEGAKARVIRNGCAAELSDAGDGNVEIGISGVLMGNEIGQLVDVGYQKTWQSPSGKRVAARAEHLKELHAFTEDLREALGMTSLYNQGLGTTNELHLYDRVVGRDAEKVTRPWDAVAGKYR
jgi:hypothetical protein